MHYSIHPYTASRLSAPTWPVWTVLCGFMTAWPLNSKHTTPHYSAVNCIPIHGSISCWPLIVLWLSTQIAEWAPTVHSPDRSTIQLGISIPVGINGTVCCMWLHDHWTVNTLLITVWSIAYLYMDQLVGWPLTELGNHCWVCFLLYVVTWPLKSSQLHSYTCMDHELAVTTWCDYS